MTSILNTVESCGFRISVSMSPTSLMSPALASTSYSSSISSGSAFLESDTGEMPIDRCRKRLASSSTAPRHNKSRTVCNVLAMGAEKVGLPTMSPRDQRALKRKEKSRLAAKMRRNQESNILSSLLRALPVSLSDAAAAEANKTSSGLNLEKSGVIRMAGQTLFLYNSLSQVLGTNAVPLISLISRSLYGLLVCPKDSTVVYATPPLAEAINWPWINLIGVKLASLTDDGKLPSRAGEAVFLRILEQTNSPTKNSVNFLIYNRSYIPLRSPSHSPTSTVSTSTADSGSDQTSPLWSPHLYRSNKNGSPTGTRYSAFAATNKTPSYIPCSCFAILHVPITTPEDDRPGTTVDSTPLSTDHLCLYLLQPIPKLGLLKDVMNNASFVATSSFGKTSATNFSPTPAVLPSSFPSASSYAFYRNKERYILNRQRRLRMQNRSSKPTEFDLAFPRDVFCTVLDCSLTVKWVENSDSNNDCIFSSMTGWSFLDFVALHDLQAVSKLLSECVQQKSLIWTNTYRLRIPVSQSSPDVTPRNQSKFIWVRTLFSTNIDATVRCLHQPIGNAQVNGIQVFLHRNESASSILANSESQRLINNALTTVTAPQVKKPIKVLQLSPQQQPLSQHPITMSTLQMLRVSPGLPTISGRYLSPLAATQTENAQIVCETLMTTPWVICAQSVCAPQTSLAKSISHLPQNSSFNFFLSEEPCKVPLQHSNKIRQISPPHAIAEPLQIEKRPNMASSPPLNLPDMLEELDPETLALLEENEDTKSNSLPTNLNFDDILSSISITPSSSDDMTQLCTDESFCSSESSPPSLSGSFVSSTSSIMPDQPSQREMYLLGNIDIGTDLPLDTDDFWDALVTNVMKLPLDIATFPMDVR